MNRNLKKKHESKLKKSLRASFLNYSSPKGGFILRLERWIKAEFVQERENLSHLQQFIVVRGTKESSIRWKEGYIIWNLTQFQHIPPPFSSINCLVWCLCDWIYESKSLCGSMSGLVSL
jgi:hypothetical protein